MNKSKFLKKSLAMVLAVMLVVAMIPMSASAAAAPEISAVTIGTASGGYVGATLSGDTYTAEITNPGSDTVKANITLKDGVGSVYHDTNDATANGVTTITFTGDEKTAKSASFSVFDSSDKLVGTYKLTYTVAPKSNDTTVKSVKVDGQYGDTVLEGTTYTITVPYNQTSAVDATVVLNNNKSFVTGSLANEDATFTVTNITPDATNATSFTVQSEAGSQQTYKIKVVKAKAFTEFSVKGERKAADIYGVTEGFTTSNKVVVHLPYGTKTDAKGNFKFVPTFKTGYASVVIEATKTGASSATTIKSGEEINLKDYVALSADADFTSAKTLNITVKYTNGVSEAWTIDFEAPSQDPVASISSLKIGAYVAEINDRNITIEVPKSVRATATAIDLGISTGAKAEVVGKNINATAASDKATLTFTAGDLADGKNSFTIRVTAAGNADGATKPETKDFYLTIKTAEPKQAQVLSMVLENTAKDKKYEAAIDQTNGTITFKVPYAVRKNADMAGWKLYYSMTSGAVMTGYTAASGEAITGTEGIFPTSTTGFDGKTAGATPIKVTTAELSEKTYQVYLKNDDASQDCSLKDFKVTDKDKFEDMTDATTYSASGSTDLTVSIPYGKYSKYDEAFVSATLPEGAALYYVDNAKKLKKLDVLTEDVTTAATVKLPSVATYKYDGVTKTAGQLTPLTLVVASEASSASDGANYDSAFIRANVNKIGAYTLTVKSQIANTTAKLNSFSVYDATTKKTVQATISSDNEITVTLPYYFDATKAGKTAKLYIDYKVSGGETVKLNNATAVEPLTFKADGTVSSDSMAVKAVYNAAGHTMTFETNPVSSSQTLTTINLDSEDNSAHAKYDIVVKFANAEKGATLNSVKINNMTATPDSNNKVKVNLPYATEITHLVPSFDVSTNAYVTVGTAPNIKTVTPDMAFNFTSPVTFTVRSEDSANSTIYTVSVDTAEQFTDVKPGDWFYDDVMAAAAKGIVVGVGNGRFNPKGNVTRAQFATMMARVDGFDKDAYMDKTPFTDVKAGSETSAAIAYCAEKGYIDGYGDTTFKPSKNITREEMASILCKTLGLTEVKDPANKFADDAKIANWAKGYVYACAEKGILKGDKNKYDPKGLTTRAQAATVAIRVDNVK